MKYSILTTAALLSACAAPLAPPPVAGDSGEQSPVADMSEIRADLMSSVRSRVGDAAVDYVMAQPTHLIAKVYPGMSPPPPPGAGPEWRPPSPSAALYHDGTRWMVATATGFRAAKAEEAAVIDQIIADPSFWGEPVNARPGCTDAGAALFLVKVPGRVETVRRGACVTAPLGERLAYKAVNT